MTTASGDLPKSIPSVADRVRAVTLGGEAIAAGFVGDHAVFVLGDEEIVAVPGEGEPRRIGVHAGAILSVAQHRQCLITGGDDGRVVALNAALEPGEVARDPKSRWIDQVAVAQDLSIAWSAGKSVFVKPVKGEQRTIDVPSTAAGLAFAPKGFRLAVAHYNGATLWFPNMQGEPVRLEWKGSHLGIAFSPDGRFLVTTMQEAELHGWRLDDAKHMRMSGYPGRVRSFAFAAGGKWLATSGADAVILWPFQTKDGPMGKQPAMWAPLSSRVTRVAAHPSMDVVAAGYGDGIVLLVRLQDGAEIIAHRGGGGAVTALAWSHDGAQLAFALENGTAGVLTV